MRSVLATALFIPSIAFAGPTGGGGGGGGGALSKVSAGVGSATRASSSSSSSGSSEGRPYPTGNDQAYSRDVNCYNRQLIEVPCPYGYATRIQPESDVTFITRRYHVTPSRTAAKVDFYAGAQKVHDSDGSGTIELGVIDERFRLDGTFTRYFERQQGGGVLTMTMPTLTGGFRIDDMGPTAVYLQIGVVHARSNGDAMGDWKITGPIAGMRVEHTLNKDLSVIGDIQRMWFSDDISATAGRVGVRYRYAQLGFRVLDFNVGTPLYGPEVGVRF